MSSIFLNYLIMKATEKQIKNLKNKKEKEI